MIDIILGYAGFYTKLNVWGSLGLKFDYDGDPIIENGGSIVLCKSRILEVSTSFCKGIRTGEVFIFVSQPFVSP